MCRCCADLLDAKHQVRDVDELLQSPELVAVAAACGGLKATAHDAAAHINVRGGSILIRQTQRFLESPDLVRFITPAGSLTGQGTLLSLRSISGEMQSCGLTSTCMAVDEMCANVCSGYIRLAVCAP